MPHRIRLTTPEKADKNINIFLLDKHRERAGGKDEYPKSKAEIIIPSNLRAEELGDAIKDNFFGLYSECTVSYSSPLTDLTPSAIQVLPLIRSAYLKLIISNQIIGNEQLNFLATAIAKCDNLNDLDFSFNDVGNELVGALSAVLGKCPNLHTLDLSSNNIEAAGAVDLFTALYRCKHLRALNLSFNDIEDAGVGALSTTLSECPNLETLNLSFNGIGFEGVGVLSAALSECPHLHTLILSDNHIGDPGTRLLIVLLSTHPHLQTLNLADNDIGTAGARDIAAKLPKFPNLETLNLAENEIEDEGLALLARALYITNELRKETKVKPLNIVGVELPTLTLEEKAEADSEVLIIQTERLRMALPSARLRNPTSLSATTATSTLSQ